MIRFTWAVAAAAMVCHGSSFEGAKRDFSFFVISDTHIGVKNLKANPPVTVQDNVNKLQKNLSLLFDVAGKELQTKSTSPGKLKVPLGLFILGDLTDGSGNKTEQEQQWKLFNDVFPASGLKSGKRRTMVYAIAGNHDNAPNDPQRAGLAELNRSYQKTKRVKAISPSGGHFAINWKGVHIVCLSLCPADSTDEKTPFVFGKPGPDSWNDPQGGFSFLRQYLEQNVGKSGDPVIVMHHYGFDGFSTGDWLWWTALQRKALYDLLAGYNVAALFHGHDHAAASYTWPDSERHASDLTAFFSGTVPSSYRQYPVLSCGSVGWVVQIKDDRMLATHIRAEGEAWKQGIQFQKNLAKNKRD